MRVEIRREMEMDKNTNEVVLEAIWQFLYSFDPSSLLSGKPFPSLREGNIGALSFHESAIETLRNSSQIFMDDLSTKCMDSPERKEAIKIKVTELRNIFESCLKTTRECDLISLQSKDPRFQSILDGHSKPFADAVFSTTDSSIALHLHQPPTSNLTKTKAETIQPPSLELTQDSSSINLDDPKTMTVQGFIIEALEYSSMTDRKSSVETAHAQTFAWLFEDDQQSGVHNFKSWLSGFEKVYWISGKFGSGKSTLLNFLFDHPKTKESLEKWSQGKKWIMARFFAWSSGSVEQRSMRGLLRTLLFQILEGNKQLVHFAFPELWRKVIKMDTKERIKFGRSFEWDLETLMDGMRYVLEASKDEIKYCFFVDGLDEFEGEDQDGIIQFLKDLGKEDNVKICLSSRPWKIFEDAFQNVPKMYLQNLTTKDMLNYFNDQFTSALGLAGISSEFMQETVERSQGVFLWLTLIVKCLREDVSVHSPSKLTSETLTKLLHAYPSDLEDLFRYLLFNRQSKECVKAASRIFQLLRARERVCDHLKDEEGVSLKELGEPDEEDVICCSIERADVEETWDDVVEIKGRVESRCAGLLKVNGFPNETKEEMMRKSTGERWDVVEQSADSKITYLHRTVRDFLVSAKDGTGVWTDFLWETLGEDFNPHIVHLRNIVWNLKRPYAKPKRHRWFDLLWEPHVVRGLTHARFAEEEVGSTSEIVDLVDELEESLNWFWEKRKDEEEKDHWARNTFGVFEERGDTKIYQPFLTVTLRFGLSRYVNEKLKENKFKYQGSKPRLSFAVDYLVNNRQTIYPLSSLDMVQEIFQEDDADPNREYKEFPKSKKETSWIHCIKLVREANRRGWIRFFDDREVEGTKRWVGILEMFLDHGADVNAVIKKDAWDEEVSVIQVVEQVVKRFGSKDVKRLLDKMIAKTVS